MSRRPLLAATLVAGLMTAGVVWAQSQPDTPAATPATPPQDPIGDILKSAPPSPGEPAPPVAAPVESAPGPTVITVPAETAVAPTEPVAVKPADKAPVVAVKAEVAPLVPGRRQRRPIVIVEAIDKITAESMRFEVEVGGRPVRFNGSLIFTARACEVSAPDEPVADSVAYLEVAVQPRGVSKDVGARQVFKGWMFASSPGVSGLEHPIYDAWVVGCKA